MAHLFHQAASSLDIARLCTAVVFQKAVVVEEVLLLLHHEMLVLHLYLILSTHHTPGPDLTQIVLSSTS